MSLNLGRAPPYGMRRDWIPRSDNDFGDGGAFPEIHIPQYPLTMGLVAETSNALAIPNTADEDAMAEILLRQGHDQDRVILGKPSDAVERDMELKRLATAEEKAKRTKEVKEAFEKQLHKQLHDSKVVKKSLPKSETETILYTPAQNGPLYNGGHQQRIMKISELPTDPMEPPRFQINKKIPRGPPEPPAAILTSPTRAATKREKEQWKIPPCVSNWKNPRGYTVPLANRVAADGRNNQTIFANDKHSSFTEALFLAERKAREQIRQKNQLKQKILENEKKKDDEKLKQYAMKVREQQNLQKDPLSLEERERNEIRHERQRDRNREKNRGAGDARGRASAFENRDISEQIALGQANPLLNKTKDDQVHDRRLMDKQGGLDSGFSGGADDVYNLYDKPLFNQNKSVYKAPRNTDMGAGLDDVSKYSKQFLTEKEARDEPVAFEKDDPFALDDFLTTVKATTTKRPAGETSEKTQGGKRRK